MNPDSTLNNGQINWGESNAYESGNTFPAALQVGLAGAAVGPAIRLFREDAGAAPTEFRSRLVSRMPEDSNHSLVRNSGLGLLAFLVGKIRRLGLLGLDFEMKLNQRLHGSILRQYYPPNCAPEMAPMNVCA